MDTSHRERIQFGISTEKRQPVATKFAGIVAPHVWKEITPDQLPNNFITIDQDGASNCGAQAGKKLINFQTNGSLIVSAHPVYRARSTFPSPGMVLDDIVNLPCTQGTTLEVIDSSNLCDEDKMSQPITVPTPISGSAPQELNVDDIEELASACDVYGGVVVTANIAWSEWNTEQGIPAFISDAVIDGGHAMAFKIPAIYKGVKGLFGQNSWGNDGDSINQTSWIFLTEDFLKNRGTGAGTFKVPPVNPNPLFPRTLQKGMNGKDVEQLQKDLGGLKIDGDFGPITRHAVMAFQSAHSLLVDGVVGPKTVVILTQTSAITPPGMSIIRENSDTKETTGTFMAVNNGKTLTGYTLELPWLNNQQNISCLPTGMYECSLAWQVDLKEYNYQIQSIPGRDGVFIHWGNFYKDSKGCILTGSSLVDLNGDGEKDVASTRAMVASIKELFNNQPFKLTITNL